MDAITVCCMEYGWGEPETEYQFAKPRRWRFDYAWPAHKLALEIEGGVWTGGRHTRGAGFLKDMEKYNEAALRGWKLLRATPQMVKDGSVLTLLERAFRSV